MELDSVFDHLFNRFRHIISVSIIANAISNRDEGIHTRNMNKNSVRRNLFKKSDIYESGKKLNIEYFKVWGYHVYCKNTNSNRIILCPRGIKCAFIGYASDIKSYRLLNLKTNVIIESNAVEFFENSLSSDNELKENHKDIPSLSGTRDETSSKDVDESIEP
ncbi:uncharacterized protein LOC111385681 [Olea europaea var. sylvestris]|uniref:uncharacterized protein LOC111385681 n=1 Tax=Olea europaea var. sylvestris TaxID=158386 RepID=UPI000C1CE75D|nr:uncharacterized protein LOC111385681 [Olea europaea var. sylvestris]